MKVDICDTKEKSIINPYTRQYHSLRFPNTQKQYGNYIRVLIKGH